MTGWLVRAPAAPSQRAPSAGTFWARWTGAIMRRPVLAALGSTAVLLALAVPALQLQMSNGALQQFPPGHETRVGFEAAAKVIGAGAASPVEVVAPRAQLAQVQQTLRARPRDRARRGAARSRATATACSCARSRATTASRRRRARSWTGCARSCPRAPHVGGSPAFGKDFADRISSRWG